MFLIVQFIKENQNGKPEMKHEIFDLHLYELLIGAWQADAQIFLGQQILPSVHPSSVAIVH